MRRVAVIEPLHLSSTRIPRKILQWLGADRLLDRGITNLCRLQTATGVPVYVAAWEGDKEIISAIQSSGLRWLPMTEEASRADDWVGIYGGFAGIDADWVLHTHFTCHPFARVETYQQAIERCREAEYPFVMATSERTIAWTRVEFGPAHPLIESSMLDSRKSPELIRPSHLGGACTPKDFLTTKRMAKAVPFVPDNVQDVELLDCDTMSQLNLLRIVERGRDGVFCDGPLNGTPRHAIEAIALGAGPSLIPWSTGVRPKVPLYGCSWIPTHVKLDTYCYGDAEHRSFVPTDGTRIVATETVIADGMEVFDVHLPHAGQTGGMAISEACRRHRVIGLVGFDGGLPEPYENDLRELIKWWKKRGRTFVSLMPQSTFDDLMGSV